MLLITSSVLKPNLNFIKLADCMQYLLIIAKWAEDEWGYIRNKGIQYRESVMDSLKDVIYVGIYANQPVAMFALLNNENHAKCVDLMYVYVAKNCRGLGFGKQIIQEAKRLAIESDADLILLDTLKSNLTRLYEKHGAEVICEGRFYKQPSDVLAIRHFSKA